MSTQTKRDYLVSLGLAKADARGRFSKEAQAALDKAVSEGMVFADTPSIRRETVVTQPYDARKVRRWAEKNGISLGQRGRVPADIVARFYAENPDEPVTDEVIPPTMAQVAEADSQARAADEVFPAEPVRDETVAFVRAARPEDAPEYISEPVVGFTECAKCKHLVAFCGCEGGPVAPAYLTNGETVHGSLTQPE